MAINLDQVQKKLGVVLLFSVCIMVSLSSVLIRNPYIRGMVVWVGFALLVLQPMAKNMVLVPSDLFIVGFMFVVASGLLRGTRETVYSVMNMIPFMLLYFLVRLNGTWIRPAYTLLVVTDLVYAFFTFFFFFAPAMVYYGIAYTLFPSNIVSLISWYNHGWMAGLTSHYSTNGILMATGVMLSFCKMLPYWQGKDRKRWGWAIAFVLFTAALLLTGKRGPLIFGFAGVFVVYYFSMENDQGKRWTNILGVGLAVFCIGFVLITWVPALAQAFYRFVDTSEAGDVTLGREKYWAIAVEQFKKNPVFGIGWGQFRVYAEAATGKDADTHNVYLQLLCECGVFGLVSFLLMYLQPIRMALVDYITMIRNREEDMEKRSLLSFAVCFQVFFILYCFTGNPLYTHVAYMPYYFSCAIVAYYHFGGGRKKAAA